MLILLIAQAKYRVVKILKPLNPVISLCTKETESMNIMGFSGVQMHLHYNMVALILSKNFQSQVSIKKKTSKPLRQFVSQASGITGNSMLENFQWNMDKATNQIL